MTNPPTPGALRAAEAAATYVADLFGASRSDLENIDIEEVAAIIDREMPTAELLTELKAADCLVERLQELLNIRGVSGIEQPYLRRPERRAAITKVAQVESRDMDRGRETESTPAPKVPQKEEND